MLVIVSYCISGRLLLQETTKGRARGCSAASPAARRFIFAIHNYIPGLLHLLQLLLCTTLISSMLFLSLSSAHCSGNMRTHHSAEKHRIPSLCFSRREWSQ